MILPGLTSVTFRNKSPEEVLDLASKAGLKGIEWGGDIHVPPGRPDRAEEVYSLTLDAGLKVNAYGSYYVVGKSSEDGTCFADVLDTAELLDAPLIRIWAGDMGSSESTPRYRKKVLEETREIADTAGRKGISLAFEFHENTLNDGYVASYEFLTDLAHPWVSTLWQPVHGAGQEFNGAGIDLISGWIKGIHVFHWWPDAMSRLPLREGMTDWRDYLSRLSSIPGNLYGNLEFVKDDSPDQFLEDAETLLEITGDC